VHEKVVNKPGATTSKASLGGRKEAPRGGWLLENDAFFLQRELEARVGLSENGRVRGAVLDVSNTGLGRRCSTRSGRNCWRRFGPIVRLFGDANTSPGGDNVEPPLSVPKPWLGRRRSTRDSATRPGDPIVPFFGDANPSSGGDTVELPLSVPKPGWGRRCSTRKRRHCWRPCEPIVAVFGDANQGSTGRAVERPLRVLKPNLGRRCRTRDGATLGDAAIRSCRFLDMRISILERNLSSALCVFLNRTWLASAAHEAGATVGDPPSRSCGFFKMRNGRQSWLQPDRAAFFGMRTRVPVGTPSRPLCVFVNGAWGRRRSTRNRRQSWRPFAQIVSLCQGANASSLGRRPEAHSSCC
jgi:hypothetical protein